MSNKRRESAKRIKSPDGVTLCSCGCGRIPEPPRKTWFSSECVEKWREKNDPTYIRQKLKDRDKGICAGCGCDAKHEYMAWKMARKEAYRLFIWLEQREERRLAFTVPPHQSHDWHRIAREAMWPDCFKAGKLSYNKIAAKKEVEIMRLMGPHREGWTAGRKTAWDADHILEVVNGGGLCGLENYQTLCHPCHKAKTAKLARERAVQRRREKLIQAGDLFVADDTGK